MKWFKSVDKKLADIGFMKVDDGDSYVSYEREIKEYGYTQCLDILHKASGRHIVQSYDKDTFDENRIGNLCVGLSYYEMKLIMKKMHQKGWKSK